MRVEQPLSGDGRSAYDVLANATERELADIFVSHSTERAAPRIAREIVRRRRAGTLPRTTLEFAHMITGLLVRVRSKSRLSHG